MAQALGLVTMKIITDLVNGETPVATDYSDVITPLRMLWRCGIILFLA